MKLYSPFINNDTHYYIASQKRCSLRKKLQNSSKQLKIHSKTQDQCIDASSSFSYVEHRILLLKNPSMIQIMNFSSYTYLLNELQRCTPKIFISYRSRIKFRLDISNTILSNQLLDLLSLIFINEMKADTSLPSNIQNIKQKNNLDIKKICCKLNSFKEKKTHDKCVDVSSQKISVEKM